MRIIVPYAKLFPETKAALDATGRTVEYVDVGHSLTAYHELLLQVWHEGQGFLLVEHDIVSFPGAIDELEACPDPWCGRPYWLGSCMGSYLGFTRFSESLVRDNPGLMDELDGLKDDGTPKRYWGRLDSRLGQVLNDHYGLTIHVHWPAVEHLNPAKQMGGGVNCVECGHRIPWRVLRLNPPPWPCDHDPEQDILLPVEPIAEQSMFRSGAILNCVDCGGAITAEHTCGS